MMYYNYYYSTKKEFFLLGEKTYIISILTTLEKYSYVLYGIRVRVRDVRAYYKVTHTLERPEEYDVRPRLQLAPIRWITIVSHNDKKQRPS